MDQKSKRIFQHIRKYILRGLFAIIPISLTMWIVYLIYAFIDSKVMGLIDQYLGVRVPGLGVLLLLLVLYMIGIIAGNILGRRFINLIENILSKVPILNTTYHIGKQLSNTLSLPEKQVFKKVVLVDYFKPRVWSVGFVTGSMLEKRTGDTLLKVFIPTVPNPTSGILVMLKESETRNPGWTVEEGMRMVISGGIIGPESIKS